MASGGSNVRLSLAGITGTTAEILYTIDTTGRYEDGYLIVFNENNTEVSRTSSFRAYGNSSGSQNVTGIASGHLYTVKFYSTDLGVYSESTVEIDLRSGDPAYAISSSSTATSVNIVVSPISSATMGADGVVVVESVSDGIKESIGYKSSNASASITLVGLDQNTEYTFSVTYYDPGLASSVTNAITISTSELGAKQGPKLYGMTGKNLLKITNTLNYDSNGITFTYNSADKTYTLNGQNNGSGNSACYPVTNNGMHFRTGKYYSPYDSSPVHISYYKSNWSKSGQITSNGVVIDENDLGVYIEVSKGQTHVFDNEVFYPIIAKEPVTIEDFEPYSGYELVTKLYGAPILGKNLSPPLPKYTRTGINRSATVTTSGDTMTVAAAAGGAGPWYRATAANMAVCPYLFQAGNMISFDVVATSSGQIEIGFEDGSGFKYYNIGTTTTRVWVPTQNGGTFHIYSVDSGVTFTISNFQVEHGSTATAYEAFQGGETVLLDKLYGGMSKNLVKSIGANWGTSNASITETDGVFKMTAGPNVLARCVLPLYNLVEGETYVVSFKVKSVSVSSLGSAYTYARVRELSNGGNWIGNSQSMPVTSDYVAYSFTFTANSVANPFLWFYLTSVNTNTNNIEIYVKDIQLEKGSSATSYESFVGSKLIHVSRPDKVYGYVTYYTDANHTITTTEPLRSQIEVNSLAGNSGSWSATVDGETVTNSDIVSVVLGPLVATIPDWFLANCDNLTSLEIDQSSATSIPDRFLAGCTSVTDGASVILPSSLTSIGDYFMYGCNGLTSAPTFPGSLTTIGRTFMNDCTNMTLVVFPASLTSIGQEMLSVCNRLESVYVGSLSANIAAADSSGAYSFSVLTSGVPAYTTGIKILGDSSVVSSWTTKFPNRNSTPFRKLLGAGY